MAITGTTTNKTPKRAVSVKEVAELAGVHRTTASKVLNNNRTSRINEVTRKRILRVAERLGFQTDELFSLPKEAYSFGLLSVLGYSRRSNPFFSDVFDGVMEEAEKRGMNVYVMNNVKRFSFKDLFKQEYFLGMISIGANADTLAPFEMANLPLVGIEAPQHLSSPVLYSVRTDSFQGTYESTKHLIECGHKNIYYLGYCNSNGKEVVHSLERFEGVAYALKEAGLFDGDVPISATFKEGQGAYAVGSSIGYEAMKKLIALNPPKPFACVCFSDTHAEGAYRAAKEAGLRICEDVSFVGYDNLESCEAMDPALTTVDVPRYELGRAAVMTLMELTEGEAAREKVLDSTLVKRKSVLKL